MIPTGPLPNTNWTILGPGTPQDGRHTSQALCACGTVRTLQNRLLVGAEARSRSCGCRRGDQVKLTRQGAPDASWCPAPLPPNGYAVSLAGSVRGDKWAASAPESADPWYVGPVETRYALRFADRRQAKEWIGRRKLAVRYPGEMSVVALHFEECAPRWLPVPLVTALRALDSAEV